MTQRVRIEHTFDCSEKAFWETFLQLDYNKEMFCQRLKFRRWEVLHFERTDAQVTRVVQVEPYIPDMPAPIKKVLGDNIGYKEEGVLDLTKNSYSLTVVPARLADKILVSGRQFTEAIEEHRCRRIFDATIEVKIFGIGSLIEKNIVSDMKKSYDIGSTFTKNYMQEHGIS